MSRIPCLVPFCRRTAPIEKYATDDVEIICHKHWVGIDRKWRKRYTMINRVLRTKEPSDFKHPDNVIRIRNRVWRMCRRQAIERAGGIS